MDKIGTVTTLWLFMICNSAGLLVTARAKAQAEFAHAHDQQRGCDQESNQESPASVQKDACNTNKQGRWTFVFAPLPISSPALGTGIVPIVAAIFPLRIDDKISPPSTVAVTGFATNNGSRAILFAGQFYFTENTYRATTLYARGNLNYNLFGLGEGTSQVQIPLKIPLKQAGELFFGEFLRRVKSNFFLGPRFIRGNSLITLRTSDIQGATVPPDLGLKTSLAALGLRLYRDTRPNRFYPTTGTWMDFTADFYSEGLGSKYSFQSYEFAFNTYWSVTTNQVLAFNVFACATGGKPPFYGNCIYGAQNELRGYTAGRYLDRYMVATQLEYRLALPKRFGLVAFGGLGEVIPGGNQPFRDSAFLPSVGGGLRFELSKKYHLNLRADVAQGRGSHTFGLGVGEAF